MHSAEGLGKQLSVLGTKLRGAKMASMALAQVGLTELQVKGKTVFEVMDLLAGKLEGMDKLKALKMGQFLRMDQATILTLTKGPEAVKKMVDEMKELGVAGESEIERSKEMFETDIKLAKAKETLSRIILNVLAPAMEWFAQKLLAFTKWANEHPKIIQAAFVGIAAAIGFVTAAMTYLTVAAYANPIVWIVLAIAAALGLVAAGIYLVYKEWEKWTGGSDTALASLFDALSDLYHLFADSKSMDDFFNKLDEFIAHAGAFMVFEFTVAFGLITDGFKKMVREMATVSWGDVRKSIGGQPASWSPQEMMFGAAKGITRSGGRAVEGIWNFLSSSESSGKKTTIHVGELNVYPPTADVVGFGTGLHTAFQSEFVLQSEG